MLRHAHSLAAFKEGARVRVQWGGHWYPAKMTDMVSCLDDQQGWYRVVYAEDDSFEWVVAARLKDRLGSNSI